MMAAAEKENAATSKGALACDSGLFKQHGRPGKGPFGGLPQALSKLATQNPYVATASIVRMEAVTSA